SYQGTAEDFAWILPLPEVPDPDSLTTIPIEALVGLDAQTGPTFNPPADCPSYYYAVPASAGEDDSGGGGGGVNVFIEKQVGNYIAAVVGSDDPTALIKWLRDHDYRVTKPMEPYIKLYTDDGMKFLALKLADDADVSDIQPFQFTLPGSAPSIPLRMTALAAEPEMGILVIVLGDQRFGPANWADVVIDDKDIVWDATSFPVQTNWSALVAEGIDGAGGQGWVTELAEPVAPYRDLLQNAFVSDETQMKARDALLALMEGKTHITRLYARLSAEEMASDPIFKRVSGGDVPRAHQLSRIVGGRDLCPEEPGMPGVPAADAGSITDDCDFVTCGAGGLCRTSTTDGAAVAGCACVPGASARTILSPYGTPQTVCQDQRMSFMNPGDRETDDATPLPDPCVGFDCGDGQCVSINLTPTCVCREGLVAIGSVNENGVRGTTCATPDAPVPSSFYQQRLPELAMNAGREVVVDPDESLTRAGGSGCSLSRRSAPTAGYLLAAAALGLVRRRRANRR
ncbi:MAG: DUF2330 domain-containing protein, partial [Myxococcales bacterium]|nr:DUF2330 domain-containing protein [Myxococcales bacterium]